MVTESVVVVIIWNVDGRRELGGLHRYGDDRNGQRRG